MFLKSTCRPNILLFMRLLLHTASNLMTKRGVVHIDMSTSMYLLSACVCVCVLQPNNGIITRLLSSTCCIVMWRYYIELWPNKLCALMIYISMANVWILSRRRKVHRRRMPDVPEDVRGGRIFVNDASSASSMLWRRPDVRDGCSNKNFITAYNYITFI